MPQIASRRRVSVLLALLLVLSASPPARAAGPIRLVKDINTGSMPRFQRTTRMISTNSAVYFTADDWRNGYELWRSDGTAAGTTLVKDIRPGLASAFPSNVTAADGTLYFQAGDGSHGRELWKSDGTELGTTLVKDIRPGADSSEPSAFAAIGSTLYFAADDGSGPKLWKSDGTAAGADERADAAGLRYWQGWRRWPSLASALPSSACRARSRWGWRARAATMTATRACTRCSATSG